MDSFDRRYYEPEVLQDGRRLHGQVLIDIDLCLECQSPMVFRAKLWAVRGLFRSDFGLEKQMRRAGWRYRYQDTQRCEECTARRKGFVCELCGMERQPEQESFVAGAPGWQSRICTSCEETQPIILLERKKNELRRKHETEESAGDMGGAPDAIEDDTSAGG